MADDCLQLPERVKHIKVDGRDVYLVGTAHISKESVQDVRTTIEAVRPDTVCIELCQGRYDALTKKEAWQKMNIFKIIREKKAVLMLAQLIMSAFYRKLGEQLGVVPGEEMLEAAKLANETGAKLVMADRQIDITLKRVWGYLGFWSKMRLMVQLAGSILISEKIDAEMIDKMKQQDQLEAVLAEFAGKFPEIKKRLIDERDIYLAQKIRQSSGSKIVAVVGAGHTPGIGEHITQDEPIEPLVELPPKSIWPKIFKWGVPAAIIALIVYGFFKQGAARGVENIYIWILVNGLLSAAGAAIAFGHPLTILTAFFAAPITSLNPLIAAGWVAGLVQAWIRTPTVADFENLPVATNTWKGMWKNPVLKVLLVTALANLGSVIGTYVAGTWIFARSV
ncbi:MAG: TraB/GumN family protein [Phycisphaerae bacterium]|jgi:pheromone shutdown-related protein TraB